MSFINQSNRNISVSRTNYNIPVPNEPTLKCRKRNENDALLPTTILNSIVNMSMSKERSRERSISNLN
jgi:hypothetical protein